MLEGVQTFVANQPGPTITIMGGVHGDEPNGVTAIRETSSTLNLKRGKVNFIIANLQALAKNVRMTEMNMNRAFKADSLLTDEQRSSYERRRALELMPFLDECDVLLDLHSSTTPGSPPFVICEANSRDIATRLPYSIISSGWDMIHPGGTDYYMNKRGAMGICVECGYLLDAKGADIANESINVVLRTMGLIDGGIPPVTPNQKFVHADSVYHTKVDFKLARKFDDFETISAGTLIGTDGGIEVRATNDGVIIFARDTAGKGEGFVIAQMM